MGQLLVMLYTGDELPLLLATTFLAATSCLVPIALTMNPHLIGMSMREFPVWITMFSLARWSIAFVATFQRFWFKLYCVPNGLGMLLWMLGDAMQLPRWVRMFVDMWCIVYWSILLWACTQLILYDEVTARLPGIEHTISANEHHNGAIFTVMAFMGNDLYAEFFHPNTCKLVRRRLRKQYFPLQGVDASVHSREEGLPAYNERGGVQLVRSPEQRHCSALRSTATSKATSDDVVPARSRSLVPSDADRTSANLPALGRTSASPPANGRLASAVLAIRASYETIAVGSAATALAATAAASAVVPLAAASATVDTGSNNDATDHATTEGAGHGLGGGASNGSTSSPAVATRIGWGD